MIAPATRPDPFALLDKCQGVRRAIFGLLGSPSPDPRARREMANLPNILADCDRTKAEVEFAVRILDDMNADAVLAPDVAMQIDEILLECQLDLKLYINDHYHLSVPLEDPYVSINERFVKSMRDLVQESRFQAKTRRLQVTMNIIREKPGFYIKEVYNWFNRIASEELSYGTIWGYVHELQERESILTIGGPQGSPKYCFPHAREIEDRARYYDMPFGIEARVAEDVSESFVPVSSQQFKDFFVLEPDELEPMILVVASGALGDLGQGETLRTFGRLWKFEYLEQRAGFAYTDGGDLRNLDMLLALKVARVLDQKEEELWFDRGVLADRSLYRSIAGATT